MVQNAFLADGAVVKSGAVLQVSALIEIILIISSFHDSFPSTIET